MLDRVGGVLWVFGIDGVVCEVVVFWVGVDDHVDCAVLLGDVDLYAVEAVVVVD